MDNKKYGETMSEINLTIRVLGAMQLIIDCDRAYNILTTAELGACLDIVQRLYDKMDELNEIITKIKTEE